MLRIAKPLLAKMHAHLEAGYPHEACGILIGEIEFPRADLEPELNRETRVPVKTVHDVILVENAWTEVNDHESQRNRFLISPEDMARADRAASKLDLDIIGFFHSHPDHPSRASETDREWAWPVISFVIVSVPHGRAGQTQSWVLRDDRTQFDEEEVVSRQ